MKENIDSFTELGLADRDVGILVFLWNLMDANPSCGGFGNTDGNIYCCNFTFLEGGGKKKIIRSNGKFQMIGRGLQMFRVVYLSKVLSVFKTINHKSLKKNYVCIYSMINQP